MTLDPSPGDRLIILAPHPDDESLATGGLILRALSCGAKIRILFGTNGDNNPWPQRWVERRWSIGPEERKRWGQTRQLEAIAAVENLGLSREAASFLNLPDQGTSRLLWQRDEPTIDRIAREIAEFRPTHCIIPSSYDLHADHNALHLLWQIAERRAALPTPPQQIHYLVHFRLPDLAPPPIYFHLTDTERARKVSAILCHKTQMTLSEKRFLAYAKPEERYHLPPEPKEDDDAHAVSRAHLERGQLHLTIQLPKRSIGATLQLCGETMEDTGLRWVAPVPLISGKVTPRFTSHPRLRHATARIEGRQAQMTLPLPSALGLSRLYVKFQRPTLFLDQTGWRGVPLDLR